MTARKYWTCQHPDGCPRGHEAWGYCAAHYARAKKSGGDPGPAEIKIPGESRDRPCAVGGCDKPVGRRGIRDMCLSHWRRWRVTEAALANGTTVKWRVRDTASYTAAHNAVQRSRGLASDHPCIDCGVPAQHWSYSHADPNEKFWAKPGASSPRRWRYSLDPDYYDPRCIKCHNAFDGYVRRSERPEVRCPGCGNPVVGKQDPRTRYCSSSCYWTRGPRDSTGRMVRAS
jgi:hypothetical protein